jgi:hypothetical protein
MSFPTLGGRKQPDPLERRVRHRRLARGLQPGAAHTPRGDEDPATFAAQWAADQLERKAV